MLLKKVLGKIRTRIFQILMRKTRGEKRTPHMILKSTLKPPGERSVLDRFLRKRKFRQDFRRRREGMVFRKEKPLSWSAFLQEVRTQVRARGSNERRRAFAEKVRSGSWIREPIVVWLPPSPQEKETAPSHCPHVGEQNVDGGIRHLTEFTYRITSPCGASFQAIVVKCDLCGVLSITEGPFADHDEVIAPHGHCYTPQSAFINEPPKPKT